MFGTRLSDEVSYLNDLRSWGTDCSEELFRVGFCVRDAICARIHRRVADPTNAEYGACAAPTGPRRFNHIFIANSFTASLNQNWYMAIVPVIIALVLSLVWMTLAVKWPTLSPFVLALMSIVAIAGIYIGWTAGMTHNRDNNYFVIIYGGAFSLIALGTWRQQSRTGRIVKIGSFVLGGNSVDGMTDVITQRNPNSITIPASVPAIIQAFCSIVFLVFVASAGYIVEFASDFKDLPIFVAAEQWYAYLLGIVSTLTLGLVEVDQDPPAYEQIKSLLCSFKAILPLNIGVILFSIFFFFSSVFFQFATKFLVSCSVADWYTAGTKSYRPIPSGIHSAGRLGLGRALWKGGHKIMVNGLWSTLGSSSLSVINSVYSRVTYLIISPVDCLVFSFFGSLVAKMTEFQSRFGLVHGSMYGGRRLSIGDCSRLSSSLIRRTFGRRFATVGDSNEVRLLSVSGNVLAVACGLIAWVGIDHLQQFDSVHYLGAWVLLIIWLTGSGIQKPGLVVMVATLVDTQPTWDLNLPDQMAKNAVMGFILMSAICNSVIRTVIEIPTSATDAVLYCFAIDNTLRRKIRSLALDEMIHVDYVGDFGTFPAGSRIERIVVKCPADHKGAETMDVDLDGQTHKVNIPTGIKPGQDFEVVVPVAINVLAEDEYVVPDSPGGSRGKYDTGSAIIDEPEQSPYTQ